MLYTVMIYGIEGVFDALPEAEQAKVFECHAALQARLKEEGTFRGTARLTAPSSGMSVRQREREVVVMDGPFAETKEQFLGLYFVECDSIEYVLQVARDLPQGIAEMEVRAVAWSDGL